MNKAKTNISVLCTLLFTILCILSVNAGAVSIQAEADSTSGKVTVYGSVPNFKGNYVFITVLNPNANGMEDIYNNISEEEFLSKVYNIMQVRLEDNNTFTYEFPMNDTAKQGWYSVYLSGDGLNEISGRVCQYFYVNEGKIRQTVGKLNDVKVTEFESLLLDIGIVLGEDYNQVKADTYDNFCTIRNELGGFGSIGNIDTIVNAVREVFQQAKALALLDSAKESDITNILETYSKYLDLNLSDDYSKAKSELGIVFVAVRDDLNIKIDSKSDFINVYEQSLALGVLNTSDRTSIHDVLVKYNNIFKLNLDGNYKKLDKLDVAKALAFSGFKSVREVAETFNNTVLNLYEKLNGKTPSKSSGGSGGGGGGGVYTVINENNAVPVDNPSTAPIVIFHDLDSVEWAKESIVEFAKRGIISGADGKNFLPDNTVTREEFVKIMVMALDLGNSDFSQTNHFNDVDESQWYYKFILISNQMGIVNGKSSNAFGVGESLTRQDLAVICYRAAKAKGIILTNNSSDKLFGDDADIADYAKDAVYSLSSLGIINGVGDNCFSPKSIATRAQAVKIMYEITRFSK